jgi:hypothetical protein
LPGVFPLFIYLLPPVLMYQGKPYNALWPQHRKPWDWATENHRGEESMSLAAINNLHLWFKIKFIFKLQTPAASICISHGFDSLRVNFKSSLKWCTNVEDKDKGGARSGNNGLTGGGSRAQDPNSQNCSFEVHIWGRDLVEFFNSCDFVWEGEKIINLIHKVRPLVSDIY